MTARTIEPHSGNADCDAWIVKTFRREEVRDSLGIGLGTQELHIEPILNSVTLREAQLRSLLYYLKVLFCDACGGTGFDPDSLNGQCEYCSDHPF